MRNIRTIMDHRNESFNGKSAYFEDVSSRSKAVNRSITTKVGLKDYTQDEIEEKCGEIVEYNYNERYSFEQFKEMPERNKREYISHLRQKYEGLRLTDLKKLFGITETQVDKWIKPLRFKWARGGQKMMCEGRVRFYEEMFEKERIEEPKEETKNVESNEKPYVFVDQMSVTCDVDAVGDILKLAGFKGRVRVFITSLE